MDTLIRLLADGLLLVILAISGCIGLWYIWRSAHKLHLISVVIMAGLTSLLIAKLISLVYQPSTVRPFIEQGVSAGAAYINNPGFPSDHALLATVAVAAVWWVTRNRTATILLALCVVVMCVARVMALVHTPLDVVGGIAIGLAGALWYRTLRRKA